MAKTERLTLFWFRGKEVKSQRRVGIEIGKRRQRMSKRRKLVMVTVILTLAMLVIQSLPIETRIFAVACLGVVAWGLAGWALRRDLRGVAWISNLLLPSLFAVAVAAFYYWLPQQAGVRYAVLAVFAVSMYALLLTVNIFAVATNRTIQLLRAARTVGFLLSIVSGALLYHVLFSLHLPWWQLVLVSGIVAWPIFLGGVWGYTLNEQFESELKYASIGAVLTAEMSFVLSFWSIEPVMASVMLAMVMYVLLGLFQHEVDRRLFGKTVQEFVGFAIIVYLVVSVTVLLRWQS